MKKVIFIATLMILCLVSCSDAVGREMPTGTPANRGFEKEVGVWQSPSWMMIYGTDILLNGEPLDIGDTIFVYCKGNSEESEGDKLVGAGRIS